MTLLIDLDITIIIIIKSCQ